MTACDRAGRNRQLCHLKTTTPQRHTRQLNITPPNKKETQLNEPMQDSRCKLEANGAYWTECFVALPQGDCGGNGFSYHSPMPYCTPSHPTPAAPHFHSLLTVGHNTPTYRSDSKVIYNTFHLPFLSQKTIHGAVTRLTPLFFHFKPSSSPLKKLPRLEELLASGGTIPLKLVLVDCVCLHRQIRLISDHNMFFLEE